MDSTREARIQQAIADYQTRKYPSIRTAATANNVNYATLGRRLRASQSAALSHEAQQPLSNTQEEMLKRWIQDLEALGQAPSHNTVRLLAKTVSKNSGGKGEVGGNWLPRFLQRHPNVRSKAGKSVWAKCVQIADLARCDGASLLRKTRFLRLYQIASQEGLNAANILSGWKASRYHSPNTTISQAKSPQQRWLSYANQLVIPCQFPHMTTCQKTGSMLFHNFLAEKGQILDSLLWETGQKDEQLASIKAQLKQLTGRQQGKAIDTTATFTGVDLLKVASQYRL